MAEKRLHFNLNALEITDNFICEKSSFRNFLTNRIPLRDCDYKARVFLANPKNDVILFWLAKIHHKVYIVL